MDTLGSDLESPGSEMQTLESGLASLGSEMDSLGSEVDSLGSEVDSPGSEVDSLGSEVNSLGSEVDSLGSEVDSLGSALESLPDLGVATARDVELAPRLERAGARVVAIARGPAELERQQRWAAAVVDLERLDARELRSLARAGRLGGRALLCVGAGPAEALHAFAAGAVAFLSRPYSADDVATALDRLARWHATHRRAPLLAEIARLSAQRRRGALAPRRLVVRRRGQRELVELGAISTVRARRNEVEIRHVAGRALYRSTLTAIAERLAPFGFLRVHRSLLVRSDAIVVLRRRRGGDAELLLVDGERIALSPKQARGLERAMAVASEGRDRVPRGAAGGGASRRGEAL